MAGYTINQLPTTTTLSTGDQIPVFVSDEGSAYKASLNTLLSFFSENWANPEFTTVVNVPVEGFNYSLATSTGNIWLILNPATGLTSGSVVLPSSAIDGQQVAITLTQSLDTISITAADTVASRPTRITSGGGTLLFRFDETTSTWWLVSSAVPRGLVHSSGVTFGVGGNGTLAMDSQGAMTLNGGGTFNMQSSVLDQTPVAIASLPAASSVPGGRMFVNNHNAALTFGVAPTAGGTTIVPVYSNGTSWLMG